MNTALLTLGNYIEANSLHTYSKDRKGKYIDVSCPVVEMAGVQSNADLIGLSDFDLSWKNEAFLMELNDQKVIHSEKTLTFIEKATCADGLPYYFLSRKSPLRLNNNKIVGIIGISFLLEQDSSLLKKYNEINPFIPKKSLTQRQLDCLVHLVKGKTIKQIAQTGEPLPLE